MRGKERGFRVIAIFLAFAMIVEMAGMHLGTAVFATEAESAATVVSDNTTEVSVETETQVDGNSLENETEIETQSQEDLSIETEEPKAEQAEIENATIELMCTDFSSTSGVKLAWTAGDVSGLASFDVYRDGAKIGTVDVTEGTEYAYTDVDVEADLFYTYQIFGMSAEGEQVMQSEELLVEVMKEWVVTENTVLSENVTVKSLTITNGASLNLGGYQLTVAEEVNLEHGYLYVESGYLECEDFITVTPGEADLNIGRGLYMQEANGYIHIKNDLNIGGKYQYIDLENGCLEIEGDFYVSEEFSGTFNMEKNNIVVLSGEEKQTVTINGKNVFFNILELDNKSEDGVSFDTPVMAYEFYTNGCKVNVGVENGICGWTLEEDETFEGDLVLVGDTLDLNGHKLTVTGNLTQVCGNINVNGGTLDVAGDYYAAKRETVEGEEVISAGGGLLIMTKAQDRVIVGGDFYMGSGIDNRGYLTNGVLEVKGDVTQKRYVAYQNFVTSGEFCLLLSGEEKQVVDFNEPDSGNKLTNLEITNESEEGVYFVEGHVYVLGKVNDHGNKSSGYIMLASTTTFTNGSFAGSVYTSVDIDVALNIGGDLIIHKNYSVDINKNITVGGDVIGNGSIYFNGSRMNVNGDMHIKNYFSADGYLYCYGNVSLSEQGSFRINSAYVEGDFLYESSSSQDYYSGTLEVKGDFIQKTVSGEGKFYAYSNHTVILSGTEKQTVIFDSSDSAFNNLILRNYSTEGIYAPNGLPAANITWNGCKVTDSKGGVNGHILQEDETVEGDMKLDFGELDLNGHTLTVEGNLIQSGGTIKVNGGKLVVEKDYRIQTEKTDEETVTYEMSSGELLMTDVDDKVIVNGDFYTSSCANSTAKLTAGVLEIKGDFHQVKYKTTSPYNYGSDIPKNMTTGGSFKLLLSGTEKQTIYCGYSPSIVNLEIANTSDEGVVFDGNVMRVTGTLNDNGNETSGYISVLGTTTIENNVFNGNLELSGTISQPWVIYGDVRQNGTTIYNANITVNGNYTLASGYVNLNGNKLVVEGNVEIGEKDVYSNTYIQLNGGEFYCSGNVKAVLNRDSYYSGFYMNNTEDYVYIGGNFVTESSKNAVYKAGTMEIKGDFTQTTTVNGDNFSASGSHTVILSGTEKQTVLFDSETSTFYNLVLENTSDEGIYAPNGLHAENVTWNDSKISGVTGTKGYKLTEDTTITEDFYMSTGEMDLNGFTLTVKGNLIQAGGKMNINGGCLVVEGNYYLQTETKAEDETVTYGSSKGLLVMLDEDDRVIVHQDMRIGAINSSVGKLSAGILEVKGDFSQITYGSASNFATSDVFKMVLSGDGAQTISFDDSSSSTSCIMNLEITNASEEGVILEGNNITVTNVLTDNGNKVTGYLSPGYNMTMTDNSFSGSIYLEEETYLQEPWKISGNLRSDDKSISLGADISVGGDLLIGDYFYLNDYELIVDGDVIIGTIPEEYSYLYVYSGTLRCNGNLTICDDMSESTYYSRGIQMNDAEAYVYVGGDFLSETKYTYTDSYSKGTMEIKGDFTQRSSYRKNTFAATGEHIVILSGDSKQTVYFDSSASYFNVLDLQNTSEEGVYFNSPCINAAEVRLNNTKVHLTNNGVVGWTLEDDTVIDGDISLAYGDLDLNGYTLTVTGNLYVGSGNIIVNEGKLEVKGDLRYESVSYDENGEIVLYEPSNACLTMTKAKDHVLVHGDFIMRSSRSMKDKLTHGIMEIKGDFQRLDGNSTEYGYSSYANYPAEEDHTILLSGDKKQTMTFGNNSNSYISNLVVENTSDGGVLINQGLKVNKSLTDTNAKISKGSSVTIPTIDVIKSEKFGGSVSVQSNSVLTHDLEIGGSFSGSLDLNGFSLTTGNTCSVGIVTVNGGSLYVGGDMTVSSRLTMTNPEDYVCVNGAFLISARVDNTGYMTAGTLELRGDFTQNYNYGNFAASDDHTTILSGKTTVTNRNYVQKIKFNYPELNHFNHVILNNPMSAYSFTPGLEEICADYVYEEKDTEAPTKVEGLEVTECGGTFVTLSWDASTDNVGVRGYEIYCGKDKVGTTSSTTFKVTGLNTYSTYVFKVCAFDAMRNLSEDSAQVRATTLEDSVAPEAPTALKIATKTGSSVTVAWTAAKDDLAVTGYKVYRDGTLIDTIGAETSYKDESVELDTLYTYQLRAFDAAGNESELSESVKGSAAMPQITSFAPVDTTTIGGYSQKLTVYYTNVGNSTGNKVKFEYQVEEDGEKVWKQIGNVLYGQKTKSTTTLYSECYWTLKDVPNGERKMRVTLYDADGNTDERTFSYYVDTVGPEATDKVKAESAGGVVDLTWEESDSADCVKYIIYRSNYENGTYSIIANTEVNKYLDKDVITGRTYYYKLLGVDEFGQQGPMSEIVSVEVTPDEERPQVESISAANKRINKVAQIVVKATDNVAISTISLEYQNPETEEWIKVEEDQDAPAGIGLFAFDTNGLEDGTYKLRAAAIDTSGNSSVGTFEYRGEEITLEHFYADTIVDNTGVSKVVVKEIVPEATHVTLKWNDVPENDRAYFIVEQLMGTTYEEVVKTNTTLGATVTNLKPNREYSFRVVGYDDLGNRGVESDVIKVTTIEDKQAPIIYSCAPYEKYFANSIPLTIGVSDNVSVKSLKLEYSVDHITWIPMTDITANTVAGRYVFNYTFDVSQISEGEVYIRAYAYDVAGNVSNANSAPIEAEYVIDRTAPAKLTGIKAEGMNGYNAISWDKPAEEDIKEFRVYRAEETVGNYKMIHVVNNATLYYDTEAEFGVTYMYKVLAVDAAGNVGEYSDEVVAQCLEDTEAPIIFGVSPMNNSKITGETEIMAAALDNVAIKKVLFEYKPADTEEDIWIEIGEVKQDQIEDYPRIIWDVSKFVNKDYTIRVIATDTNNNVSDPFYATYTVDTAAPFAPILTGEAIGFGAKLSWEMNKETDFSHYEIYRKLAGEEEYTRVVQIAETEYQDFGLESERKYNYVLRAYDDVGNYAESNMCEVIPTDEDTEAPVAVTSETYSVRMGSEVFFDGSASHDNVKIAEYKWDLGNGEIKYGAKVKYKYAEMGTYYGSLTVTDVAGNTDTSVFTVRVRSRISSDITFKVVRQIAEQTVTLPHSYVYIESLLGDADNYNANEYGELTVTLSAGTYLVKAYAEGCLPKTFEVVVQSGVDQEMMLQLEAGDVANGNITTSRLDFEEMKDLGIDVLDKSNWFTYSYTITYTTPDSPQKQQQTIDLKPNVTTRFTYGGTGSGSGSGVSLGDENVGFATVNNINGKDVITMCRVESFLKRMYDVRLEITNMAEPNQGFDIVDSKATLNLPAGLSLLKMNKRQSRTNSMGTIVAQDTVDTHWYIKADAVGSYMLSADFDGKLLPFEDAPVHTEIVASDAIVVSKSENNTFTDKGFVSNPKDYVVRVLNKESNPVKGAIVTLEHGGLKCQAITNMYGNARLKVNDGDERTFTLSVEHDDYLKHIDSEYMIEDYYTDRVRLYREGESRIEEEEDEEEEEIESPYIDGYQIGLTAAQYDGRSLFGIVSSPRINRAEDRDHTLDFTFTENINKYELIVEGNKYDHYLGDVSQLDQTEDYGEEIIAQGDGLNSSTLHIDLNIGGLLRQGRIKLKVYNAEKEATYELNLWVDCMLYEQVVLTYSTDVVDLMTESYNIYTYYADNKFEIRCDVLDTGADLIDHYELVQDGKMISESTTGEFTVKVREFDAFEAVYMVAYDKNGEMVECEYLNLHVQRTPEFPQELKLGFGSDGIAIETVIDENIPIVGGLPINVSLDDCLDLPFNLEYTSEGCRVKIGLDKGNDRESIIELLDPNKKGDYKTIWILREKLGFEISLAGELYGSYDLTKFEGTIVLAVSVIGEWEQQLSVGPVPVVLAVEATGKVDATGTLVLDLSEESTKMFSGALKIGVEAALDLYAGIGVAMVASVGVYGEVGGRIDFGLLPVEDAGLQKITLKGEMGLRAKLLTFQFDLQVLSGEFPVYNREDMPTQQSVDRCTLVTVDQINEKLSDLSNYHMAERGDTSARTAWLGTDITADENVIQTLQGAAHKGEAPRIATAGNTTILFYNDDNLSQNVANGSKVAYSVYQNGVFTTPVYLSAADQAQFAFDTYATEEGIYVIWQESKEVLEETASLQTVADSIELKAAKFDAESGQVTMLGTITNNEIYESMPQIGVAGDQIYATWVENSEDDIFGKEGENTVKKAVYSGGSWTESVVKEGLGAISTMDAGEIAGAPYVVYSQGESASAVNVSTGSSMALGAAVNPQFGYVAGTEALVWYADGAIKSTEDAVTVETLFDDVVISSNGYQYVSDASGNSSVIYVATKEGKAQAYVADYDKATGLWGNVQPITDQSDYVENVSGTYNGNQMLLVFNKTKASVSADEIDASTDLCCIKVGKNPAISIKNIYYYADEIMPGNTMDLGILLENKGLAAAKAEDIVISIVDENEEEVLSVKADEDIKAGGTYEQPVQLKLPYTLAANNYIVKVTCGNSSDELLMTMGFADLKVSARTLVSDGDYKFEATVENIGIQPAGGKLVFYNREDDSVLAEYAFDELNYSETAVKTCAIPEELYDGSESLSLAVKVLTETEQRTTENDEAYVFMPKQVKKTPYLVTFDYAMNGYEKVRKYVTEGNTLTFPEEPNVKGYKFLGWYCGQTKVTEETVVTANMKITAKYEKLPELTTPTQNVPEKNSKVSVGGITYKVTKSAEKNGTVEVYKVTSKKSKVTIPKTVKIKGYTFKVTSIGKNAFKNNKKAKTVVIGDNVKTIGNNAFYGAKKLTTVTIGKGVTSIGLKAFYNCKKLKTIKINSSKLKKVGKNALKGIHKKATVKVPKKKLKAYKKLFKKKGQKSTVQIKKK